MGRASSSSLMDDLPPLGVSPMGDSQLPCRAALELDDLRKCTPEMLRKYKGLNVLPAIVDEGEVTSLMDAAIYAAKDLRKGLRPCQTKDARWGNTRRNRFDVVFDPQFSNQPACCPLENLPAGDAASTFQKGEGAASNRNNITAYTEDGIRFGRHGNVVYSFLEPTSVTCSEARKCPVVVEIPGAATIPWLLLQAWCKGCMQDLGTIVLSVDNVENPSHAYVQRHFIPAVQDFLNSRSDVDLDRVCLTSTSKGNEIGAIAVLLHPELFTFALFAGKFLITHEIEVAAKLAKAPAKGNRLQKISFHIGSDDNVHDDDQEFWSRMEDVMKPVALPVEMELRYYPGGMHAMWYAGWNAYRDLLWTGKKSIGSYSRTITMTCTPQ